MANQLFPRKNKPAESTATAPVAEAPVSPENPGEPTGTKIDMTGKYTPPAVLAETKPEAEQSAAAEEPAEPKAEKKSKKEKPAAEPKAKPTTEELTAKLAEARKTWDDLKAEQKAIIAASGKVPAELTKKITHARRAHRALLKQLGQFIPVKDRPKAEKPAAEPKAEKKSKKKTQTVAKDEQPAPEAPVSEPAPAPAE